MKTAQKISFRGFFIGISIGLLLIIPLLKNRYVFAHSDNSQNFNLVYPFGLTFPTLRPLPYREIIPTIRALMPHRYYYPLTTVTPTSKVIEPTSTIVPIPTITEMPTITITVTVTPSNTLTPSFTPTLTQQTTPTPTPSLTVTVTPTVTPTIGVTINVKINEYMVQPSSGNSEWVEFYNPDLIDLTSFYLDDDTDFESDTGSSSIILLTNINTQNMYLPYIEVNSMLNNAEDHVVLFDNNGLIIDQHNYTDSPGENKTIGRLIDGGTQWNVCIYASKGVSNNSNCSGPL
jgi:hypothetical protein